MKIELLPGAEADIIRQFRHYLVEQETPMTARRFREAVIKREAASAAPAHRITITGSILGLRSWPVKGFEIRIYYIEVRRILKREKLSEE